MVLVVDHTLVMVSRSQGFVFAGVGPAAPDVDHGLAAQEDRDGGTEVGAALDLAGERGADTFEAWLAGPVHLW